MIITTILVLYVAADAAMTYTIVRRHGALEAARRVRALFVR